MFFLRPSKRVNEAIAYIVACTARRYGIQLHAIIVMSNHWHVCVTDPLGNIAEFTRTCHSMISRQINRILSRKGPVWSKEQTSHVRCEVPADLLQKIVYTMTNPVKARLVRSGRIWPGLRGCWGISRARVVKRPRGLFRDVVDETLWPEEITLEFARPPGYAQLSDAELRKVIAAAIDGREKELQLEADQLRRPFLGRRAVLRQSPYATPASLDVAGLTSADSTFLGLRKKKKNKGQMKSTLLTSQFSGLPDTSPQTAYKNQWRQIECSQRDRGWLDAHETARQRLMQGDRDVVFPYGTYKLRILAGVNVAPRPTSPDYW